jgi:hypothetical protein
MKESISLEEDLYTIVNNEVLKDSSLSMQAKGLYAYLRSNSAGWKIYKSEVYNHFSNGRDAINSAWRELVNNGWLLSDRVIENGKFSGWNHTVRRCRPSDWKSVNRESRHSENPQLINNNSNKKQNNKSKSTCVDNCLDNSAPKNVAVQKIPYNEIISIFHFCLPSFPSVRILSDERKRKIQSIWNMDVKHQNTDFWRAYFKHVSRSPFLMGETGRGGFGIDFLITKKSFIKIIEGNYHGKGGN